MKKLWQTILGILEAGEGAFSRYPAAMICAFGVAVTTSVYVQSGERIELKIIQSLIISFVFGALLNSAIVFVKERLETHGLMGFLFDIFGILAPIIVFFVLYLPYETIHEMAFSRVMAACGLLIILFILIPAYKNDKIDFNKMVFTTLKSLIIAIIYGLVIILGFFFTAFVVQYLLYQEMSNKVYGHIVVYAAFISFAFFLGYFPSFKKDENEEKIETATNYPLFIEILLSYILIPLMTITFVVIAIWAAKILWWRNWPSFKEFNIIFSSYILFGLFLFVLISPLQDVLSRFFRRFFPVVSLAFLAIQAIYIYKVVMKYNLTDYRYFLILTWIFCVFCSVLFLVKPIKKNHFAALALGALMFFSVLPFFNYRDLSVYTQVVRTEILLKKNQMLESGSIVPAKSITTDDKNEISSAVKYITTRGKPAMAPWLNEKFDYNNDFKKVFGFDNSESIPDTLTNAKAPLVGNLASDFYSIEGYNIVVTPPAGYFSNSFSLKEITGKTGIYELQSKNADKEGAKFPRVILQKDSNTIIDRDLEEYLSSIKEYLVQNEDKDGAPVEMPPELMQLKLEGSGVRLLIVFDQISINNIQGTLDEEEYSIIARNIYIGE